MTLRNEKHAMSVRVCVCACVYHDVHRVTVQSTSYGFFTPPLSLLTYRQAGLSFNIHTLIINIIMQAFLLKVSNQSSLHWWSLKY